VPEAGTLTRRDRTRSGGSRRRGCIAAGHELTAEAGAEVLRRGGNAVDAAVCAVLTSFATESPLTGFGAGGFMLVHAGEESVLLDFFVEVPGRGGSDHRTDLVPVSVLFDETPQVFNIGASSCGVPGTAAGLAEALERFGSMPMAELVGPGVRLAREGVEVSPMQAYLFEVLEPILTEFEETRELYAPSGRILAEGDVFRFPELADSLELYAAEGPEPFYRGEVARRIADWVTERGGTLSAEDLAAYEPVARDPVRARFRGRDVLTNPPPSSGGILICLCLELLERAGSTTVEDVVAAMDAANRSRLGDFHERLYEPGFARRFLDPERLDALAERLGEELGGADPAPGGSGSTTHITVVDGDGRCATVTCSNGTGSGMLVPGTGVHVNNMLGEQDLNPLGFHVLEPGRRMTSMMAPTVVLRGGELEAGLGSGGSNRIRSAVLQVILRLVADGMPAQEAVEAGRVHFEAGIVQAEPGVDEAALERLEARGLPVARWRRRNLYFGGAQTVARDPSTGMLSGGGDPRRGGAVALA
jgi:gamma-glutamyltranspeptidase / glutathione hydrolase